LVHPETSNLRDGIIEPGYEVLKEERTAPDGSKTLPNTSSEGAERPTGKYLTAQATRHPVTNEPEINFELNDEGAKLFGDITTEWSPKGSKYFHLAIVLDGELYSAPRILGPITGGRGQITGDFDLKEAFRLANVLENPLEAPVRIEDQRIVEPSLGADTIKNGIRSAIIGTIAVAVFMLVYYFLAGLVADFALMLNVVILLAGCSCRSAPP
jgi:protein-export membrane protein SecD